MIKNQPMNGLVSACLVSAAFLAGVVVCGGATVGTSPPVVPLTRERIAQLPAKGRSAWIAYLDRSKQQRQADKDALQAELKSAGMDKPTEPPHGFSARSIPLDRDAAWYAGADARHIADVIVSFQTPAGGWAKNMDMSKEPRQKGEAYTANNLSRYPSAGDFDAPLEPDWNYVGTIDNDATTTQMNFLAKVIAGADAQDREKYLASFSRGMEYLFNAQYPNGGWPQVWPLEGGYHDAVTYNDDAVSQVDELMMHVAEGKDEFAFAPKELRARASASAASGLKCILASQIVANGVLTVWPQQADPLTLEPESGRNYEPPALSSGESASMMLLLMNDLPSPTSAEQHAIRAAAAWFTKTAIYGQSWQRGPQGRQLTASAGAGPIWARYYQIGTDMPIFGDRDKSIHDNVNEISLERRNGYSWYSPESKRALDRFATWSKEHPETK